MSTETRYAVKAYNGRCVWLTSYGEWTPYPDRRAIFATVGRAFEYAAQALNTNAMTYKPKSMCSVLLVRITTETITKVEVIEETM